jgi:sec-independent protein translocase protein TatB
MFEIGFWELALVAVVALLVFGPERLPRIARETALWIHKARSMISSAKKEINHELDLQDLKQSLREPKQLTVTALDNLPVNNLSRTNAGKEPQAKLIEQPLFEQERHD